MCLFYVHHGQLYYNDFTTKVSIHDSTHAFISRTNTSMPDGLVQALWSGQVLTSQVKLLQGWFDCEHLGVVDLAVAEQNGGQRLDAAVGSLDDQQVEQ